MHFFAEMGQLLINKSNCLKLLLDIFRCCYHSRNYKLFDYMSGISPIIRHFTHGECMPQVANQLHRPLAVVTIGGLIPVVIFLS